MNTLILLTLLQIVSSNVAYNFTCPSSAHWKIRAKSKCEPPRNYTCLFDVTYRVNVYRERCSRPRILAKGYKYVFQPNLNRATCSASRYQPFIFDTNGYSDCVYQKSLCSSLGQETYEDGNTSVDRLCTCDTDRGYSFVSSSKQQCYCNPLTEDCSCYLGINQSNKTDGLKDIKCYDDVKFTRNSYLGDMFNNSRTIKIIEFDNFKYNLNYATNRNKAAISIVILLLANFAVCIVVHRIKRPATQFCRRAKMRNYTPNCGVLPNVSNTTCTTCEDGSVHPSGTPDNDRVYEMQTQHTKSLKVTNRNEHLTAIKDGTEIRRYVRIQVIGKEGVGKSSLVRRLVGDSNMNVNSTDGIDIVKKCQMRTTDGAWVIGKVETERNKIMRRIQEAVRNEPKQSEPVSDQVIPCGGENNKTEAITSNESLPKFGRKQENESPTKDKLSIALPGSNTVEHSLTGEIKVNIGDNVTIVEEKSDIPYENDGVLSRDIKKAEYLVNTDDMKKKITEQMDKILLEIQKDQDKMTSESLVECGLWDFAGQKDYYATHQTFLNPHAIYLLVTNILDDLTTIENETDFDSIEEYIDFWFDSIHCLNTSSSDIRPTIPKGYSKHRLYPPVIVVCTHIDKYKTIEEFEKRKTEYIERFEEIFGGQDKANHNRGIHFISNTEFLERDCKKLKDKIYEVANETMFFEEELPTQWIQLENALSVLKHESKQNILSFQNFVELSHITFIEEEELLPFLTYQHKIGNIIFFEDIKEYIILQPEWLVKCFRCLVCDDHEFKRNHAIVNSTDWQHLKNTGQLSDDIIDRLFEKEPDLEFGKYKTHILHVMEKFDILVKPKFINTNDDSSRILNSYYMPCMIKQQSTSLDIIKNMFEGEKGKFSFSPWLILEFQFLPLAYFNHILFYYITRYTVCEKAGRKTLYRGKTLVNLDKTGLRKLCVCFSKNAIAFQVWKLSDVEDNTHNTILEEICRKIKELKKKLRQSISYHIKAKCSNGDYSNKEGRMTYKELSDMCENGRYLCPEHNEMHSKDDVETTWLQHADIVIAKLNKEQAENNPRNIVENEPIKEEIFTQDQASVKNNLPVSVIFSQQLNIKKSENENQNITGCIKIGNTLVFTDYFNKRLIICNSDGTDIHHIPLSYKPLYITEIDSNTVAVSCVYDKTILIINISTLSITSTFNTSGICWGISYNDNNLYVVNNGSIIHVMDLTGKVILTIPLPTDRAIYDITVDRDRLVCISLKSIYCCSLDGKLMWKFKMDGFQDISGVTTDNEGNVYITDWRKSTVLVVSDDGQHHRELLTESDGLNKPRGIYYDKKENILLVCNEINGKAFLFDVKKNKNKHE